MEPAGIVMPFAGSTAPQGYLLCDGSAVSRTDYSDLFTAIGTTYGAGDGETTFNVPDLSGRVVLGVSQSHALGTTGGEATNCSVADHPATACTMTGAIDDCDPFSTSSVGSGSSHNNMQPFLTMLYIIYAGV